MAHSKVTEQEALTPAVRVAGISPMPGDDVVAAITVAVLEAWPKPQVSTSPPPTDVRWRFGQRRWHDRAVPRQTWSSRTAS